VDPRDRLRRYLEQRRELGETELVLDGMTVEEVMRIVGARRQGTPVTAEPADVVGAPNAATRATSPVAADWREALRASGAAPPAETPARKTQSDRPPAPRPTPVAREPDPPVPGAPSPTRTTDAPDGLVVGSTARELFGSPISKLVSIEEIAAAVARCTRCPLHATATNPVPGEGSPHAELVCVGEAPGANEDATGRPFVGQAGQLLTKILAAINLRREDVFICNVLKHRPPGNRNPLPDEVTACSPYLVQQLELIRPKVIVAFGTFAAQTLLNTRLAIGKLRGQVHRYYGTPLIVTYHPAALLRNPAWKRPTWEDVQLARRILDDPQRP
jgi:DNA polymerase